MKRLIALPSDARGMIAPLNRARIHLDATVSRLLHAGLLSLVLAATSGCDVADLKQLMHGPHVQLDAIEVPPAGVWVVRNIAERLPGCSDRECKLQYILRDENRAYAVYNKVSARQPGVSTVFEIAIAMQQGYDWTPLPPLPRANEILEAMLVDPAGNLLVYAWERDSREAPEYMRRAIYALNAEKTGWNQVASGLRSRSAQRVYFSQGYVECEYRSSCEIFFPTLTPTKQLRLASKRLPGIETRTGLTMQVFNGVLGLDLLVGLDQSPINAPVAAFVVSNGSIKSVNLPAEFLAKSQYTSYGSLASGYNAATRQFLLWNRTNNRETASLIQVSDSGSATPAPPWLVQRVAAAKKLGTGSASYAASVESIYVNADGVSIVELHRDDNTSTPADEALARKQKDDGSQTDLDVPPVSESAASPRVQIVVDNAGAPVWFATAGEFVNQFLYSQQSANRFEIFKGARPPRPISLRLVPHGKKHELVVEIDDPDSQCQTAGSCTLIGRIGDSDNSLRFQGFYTNSPSKVWQSTIEAKAGGRPYEKTIRMPIALSRFAKFLPGDTVYIEVGIWTSAAYVPLLKGGAQRLTLVLRPTLAEYLLEYPLTCAVSAAVIVFLLLLAIVYRFFPRLLLRLVEEDVDLEKATASEKNAVFKIAFQVAVYCLKHALTGPRVQDAWLARHWGVFQNEYLKQELARIRQFVALPARVTGLTPVTEGKTVTIDSARFEQMITSTTDRWIEIVGAGGMGKTSLALMMASWLLQGKTAGKWRVPIWLPAGATVDEIELPRAALESIVRCRIAPAFITALIESGRLVRFVDGVSERPDAIVSYLTRTMPFVGEQRVMVVSRRSSFAFERKRADAVVIALRMPDSSELPRWVQVLLIGTYGRERAMKLLKVHDSLDIGVHFRDDVLRFKQPDGAEPVTLEMTTLLLKMYLDKLVVELVSDGELRINFSRGQSSVYELYQRYLFKLLKPKEATQPNQQSLAESAAAIAEMAIAPDYVPKAFLYSEARKKLIGDLKRSEQTADQHLAALMTGGVLETAGGYSGDGDPVETMLISFVLDPLCEYLAAGNMIHAQIRCKSDFDELYSVTLKDAPRGFLGAVVLTHQALVPRGVGVPLQVPADVLSKLEAGTTS